MSGELAVQESLALAKMGPVETHPAAVYLAGLGSDNSRRAMRAELNKVARLVGAPRMVDERGKDITYMFLNWPALRFQHIAALKSKLMETYKPATVNLTLSALRGVLKAAWRLDLIPEGDYRKAIDVEGVRDESLPSGRELTEGEIKALFANCEEDPGPTGARDAAILGVLYFGLRRAEVVALDLEDYNQETGELRVMGKRRKERIVWVNDGAGAALADWLAVRGSEPGPLFWPSRKGGELEPRRMTTQAVYNVLNRRGERAEVKGFSPHDFRRTFVSNLLDAGADLAIVSKMAGHASVNTTARYDRRPEEAKRRAAGLLHVPYRERGA